MMKAFIRRFMAVLLCAMLALAAPFAAAEGAPVVYAQLSAALGDGTTQTVDAAAVVTTLGDVVYWVDQSVLPPELAQALFTGRLELTDETGAPLASLPLEGNTVLTDIPVQLTDPATGATYYVMIASAAAPASPEEADAVLSAFGFATPGQDSWQEESEPDSWEEEPGQDVWPEEPEETPEPVPTDTPEPVPTPTPEPVPTDTPEPVPTDTPEPVPTDTPEPLPTATLEPAPTDVPLPVATLAPADTAAPAIGNMLGGADMPGIGGMGVLEQGYGATQPPAVLYAVTSNTRGTTNNLRDAVGGSVLAEIPNGVVVTLDGSQADAQGSVWYAVTVLQSGQTGYMRDYLLTAISETDAQQLLAQVGAQGTAVQPDANAVPETLAVPETQTALETQTAPETQTVPQTQTAPGTLIAPAPANAMITSFPAYAMTLEQENGAVIVLLDEPGGAPPQGGAIPMIREPSPLELTAATSDAAGQTWYYARNMSTGDEGYVEEYKLREVTQEEAEAAVVVPEETVAPPPTQVPIETPEPTAEPVIAATPSPEPEEPQALLAGDVYHYGYNTSAQVNVREKPNRKSNSLTKLAQGTIIWVMERTEGSDEDAWCHIRADGVDGYMMAQYVQLMGVNEEARYIAAIANPETPPPGTQASGQTAPGVLITSAPETSAPDTEIVQGTPTPGEEPDYSIMNPMLTLAPTTPPGVLITSAPETDVPDTEIVRGTPEPTATQTAEPTPTATPTNTPEPSATPTATPTAEPTAEPTATPTPVEVRLYARIINNLTALRGNPNANAYLQTILNAEDVVYIYQSQYAEDGMLWYLVQYASQWGYVRADLVRVMGEQETAEYLAALEAAQATPTPVPQATPEPVGPDSTSSYARLIQNNVNLRRTPSVNGTSLGHIPLGELLLVMGTEYDGTYTWYLVDYNNQEGYVRGDMAHLLTIAELRAYLDEMAQATPRPNATAIPSYNPSTGGNYTGSNQNLADLIPVDDSWTNNVIDGMPVYATATPDPNATPTPQPPENPAALVSKTGTMEVVNVPALTETGTFSVYGKAAPNAVITATVTMTAQPQPTATPTVAGRIQLVRGALAEGFQTASTAQTRTVGTTTADATGAFKMDVTLPMPGEYVVNFTSTDGSSSSYGVTYDTGMEPEPTVQPLPTAEPVDEENGGIGLLPVVIGIVVALIIAAAVYGAYVYRRRSEEEEEEEEDDEAEASELREEQLRAQRMRASNAAGAQAARTQGPAQRTPGGAPTQGVSPYARPVSQTPPTMPKPPVMPTAPVAPTMPKPPVAPAAPAAPADAKSTDAGRAGASEPAASADGNGAPRRRRRQNTDRAE